MSAAPIDVARCRRAMQDLHVSGIPLPGERHRVIADAIARILADGLKALATEYLGVKTYAGFGDQRSDHPYAYGPKHGTIVFAVGRRREQGGPPAELGADHVYFLECVRDFKELRVDPGLAGAREGYGYDRKISLNLEDCIRLMDQYERWAAGLRAALEAVAVESHAGPTAEARP